MKSHFYIGSIHFLVLMDKLTSLKMVGLLWTVNSFYPVIWSYKLLKVEDGE